MLIGGIVKRLICLVAVSSALLTLLASAHASACTPPPCSKGAAAPAMGATVPSNAPGFTWRPGWPSPANAGAGFQLLAMDGTTVSAAVTGDPWTSGAYVLTPSAPLTPGVDYRVRYDERCDFPNIIDAGPNGAPMEQTFHVGPVAALPSALGSASFRRSVRSISVPSSSGQCFTTIDAVVIDVLVHIDPSLEPFLPIAQFRASVDGSPAASTTYGSITPTSSVVARLHAACGVRKQGDDNGPTLGVHQVTVDAHVAGAAALPAVTLSVPFVCTDTLDGGDIAPDASADAALPNDATTGDAGHANDASATVVAAGCGCRQAGGTAPGGAAVALLGALMGIVRRRSRRQE